MATQGQTFILGQGPALKAGDAATLNFNGLPHAPTLAAEPRRARCRS